MVEPATVHAASTPALVFATAVLLLVYAIIAMELMHRTTATLAGVGALLVAHFLGGAVWPALRIWPGADGHEVFEHVIGHVDWNVILLLFGMMIIIAVTERTGVFQYMALQAYKAAGGNIWRLSALLMVITAVLSAFLDNVTTMLLITPVTIELALVLGMNPIPLLLAEVFASNIGGAATLVGDPPNILVGSYANLSFMEFLVTLTPVVLICLVAYIGLIYLIFRKELTQEAPPLEDTLAELQDQYTITNHRLLYISLFTIGLVVVLFLGHSALGMEVSVAALIGAAIILPASRVNPVEILEEVEWPTLVFFIMLFIIVGAVDAVGLLTMVAEWLVDVSQGNMTLAIILIVWVAAIFSALVDNIPFTATMLPVVATMTTAFPGDSTVLWWALVLGADFGGNGTLVGASANIVTAGLAERAGHRITFMEFMRRGIPVMVVTCIIATIYLLVLF